MEIDNHIWENLSPRAKEDIFLVQNVLQGNTKSYEKLMNRYKKNVYYIALRILNNENDAEDATQECFMKAFASLDKYEAKFAFSTWLYKIASNTCVDIFRKKKIETLSITSSTHDEEGNEIQISDTKFLTPDNGLEKKERKEIINKIVNSLPERYKILIELRYYEELSYDEIAKVTNLPLGTVKAQLNRAKAILQDLITKMDDF
jgi:RNA polymerase sigma-70 factor (ECF subfamily)